MAAQARAVSDALMLVWRMVAAAAWSVRRSLRLLRWVHRALAVAAVAGWLLHRPALVAESGGIEAVLLLWPRLHGRSWRAVVERWHTRRWFTLRWESIAGQVGLSVHRPSKTAGVPATSVVPRLVRVRVSGPVVRLWVRLPGGLTVADVERAAPRLAVAANVPRVLVDPDGHAGARLTLTVQDLLGHPFASTVPDPDSVDVSQVPKAVPVGRVEDGSPWLVPVGPSAVVAGASGSGKGSVLWGLVLALGPWVRAGSVRLHGIDLKGGMELLLGRDLFSTMATTPEDAVALLEWLAEQCVDRTGALAGRVRSHTPTVAEPLHLLIVDELAAVTAYLPDRQLRDRADRALSILLSQGRAPAFVVWAFLQDPRKDVVPQRGLFQLTIGLRLRDTSEVAMVFGDGALIDLAPCHRITRHAQGTGYALPEDGGNPVRVRAGYTDDATIRAASVRFATPVRQDFPTPEPDERDDSITTRSQTRRSPRASRQPRAPRSRTSSPAETADTQVIADHADVGGQGVRS